MKPNHDLESIFSQAVALDDPVRRGDFVEQACAGNDPLKNRVRRLLAANDRAESFMDEPATVLKLPNGVIDGGLHLVGEQPGDQVGRYRLGAHLGEGGMGTVFRAEQEEPVRRQVAVKIVKPGLDTKEVLSRFDAERHALALMDHPHIARALDAGATPAGRPYFVMELVDGSSITDYCNSAQLSLQARLSLFCQVCDAIQHAHHKGIIHRDVKPRNVLVQQVDGHPVPKVIDFGIAKAVDHRLTERTLLTRYGEFIGTPAYMSPEQAKVGGLDVDTRTDVYSLGALLYELVTGCAPFDEQKLKQLAPDEMRRWIREETPVSPSQCIESLSMRETVIDIGDTSRRQWKAALCGELDWIVGKAMNKDRDRRYETANALGDDVRRYLRHEPVVARPPTLSYRWQTLVKRHRSTVITSAIVATSLLVAAVLSGWWAWQATQAKRETEIARDVAANEAASLREVVDFMNQDLMLFADPRAEPNRRISLRSVVDRASARLNRKTFEKPAVEASIRTTLGETYRGLGEYGAAEAHLQRARALYRTLYGQTHAHTLAASARLVTVLLHQDKYDEAAKELRAIVPEAQRALGPTHEVTIQAMNLEAWHQEATGQLTEAEQLLSNVLQRRIDSMGQDTPETWRAMANLAYVLQSQGRLDDALELLEPAFQALSANEAQWNPDVLRAAANLASLYMARRESEKAESLYSQTIAQTTAWLGDDHPQTLTVRHGLALVLLSKQKYLDAQRMLREVLRGQQTHLGETHTSTLATLHNLGLLESSLGLSTQAESLFRKELEGREQTLGMGHASTREAASRLALELINQSRFEDAVSIYRRILEATSREDNKDFEWLSAMSLMGLCQLKSGDSAAARSTLDSAWNTVRRGMPDHWIAPVIQSLLGEVLHVLGERSLAETHLLDSHETLETRGADVPLRWKPLGLRAATRRLMAFYESAESNVEQNRAAEYRKQLQSLLQGEPSNRATSSGN